MLTSVNTFGILSISGYFWTMQERHYKLVLYFISLVIAVTLAMQVYWNYTNYQAGKQQLINDVQASLDNAVDAYYIDLAEENIMGWMLPEKSNLPFAKKLDSIFSSIPIGRQHLGEDHISATESLTSFSYFSNSEKAKTDTVFRRLTIDKSRDNMLMQLHTSNDSLEDPLVKLTTRVIFAISNDTLELHKIDTLLRSDLERKNINLDYGIQYTVGLGPVQVLNKEIINTNALQTISKSSYLPERSEIKLFFTNTTLTILRKNITGILLSFLFLSAVIGCLLYLLKIIKQQKQLADLKNDLISNITHEFKTPIATIGVAMEAILNFNAGNDLEKNQKYAKISHNQVQKLNIMVEKLLETATLDSEELELNLTRHNLVDLLEKTTQTEAFLASKKELIFSTSEETISHNIDLFHFENALNNIIDNAIKYGGQLIEISIINNASSIEIKIKDSGTSLNEAQKNMVFEKFYRVPKGNTHDTKGFGIGLYYTKKIIEKHNGSINLAIKPSTTFIISLPHDET